MKNGTRIIPCVSRLLGALVFCFIPQMCLPQALFEMPEGVETRWASGENPKGEKGKAAQANAGRKGEPTVRVKAGER
jgi:hypothetical protein